MAARKRVQGEKSILNEKQRIAHRLIAERLGIETNWQGVDILPALPMTSFCNGETKLSPAEVREIEACIAKLINIGCSRDVLYWCVQELDADHLRERETSVATREDMAGLRNKVRGAKKAILKFRSDLLLVANASPEAHPLQTGWETAFEPCAEETMSDLLDHLTWVQGLAQSWRSPNVRSIMKSKGLLFLLAYVWLHSQNRPEPKKGKKQTTQLGQTSRYRLSRQSANEIAHIANVFTGRAMAERTSTTMSSGIAAMALAQWICRTSCRIFAPINQASSKIW